VTILTLYWPTGTMTSSMPPINNAGTGFRLARNTRPLARRAYVAAPWGRGTRS
jgi:hypothetical protein